MPRKSNKKSVKPHNRRLRRKGRGNDKLVIYRQVGRFCPDRLVTNLKWISSTLFRSITSTDASNWSYRSSGYDPDPSVLTGSIPGFTELANLYGLYRVHTMKATVEIANYESQPIVCGGWPSNVGQNSNSLTIADCLEYAGNVGGRTCFLGAANAISTKTFHLHASGTSLYGKNYNTDLDFAASTSGNPTNMFHINIFAVNGYGNFTYGVGVRVSIVYTIEFFERRQLES